MSRLAGGVGPAHPLAALPRVWWFPGLRGYRSGKRGTYLGNELDDQPPVPGGDELSWLEDEAEKPEWNIAEGDPVRSVTPAGLEAVAGNLPVPSSLRLLAARGDLQRRIRSATACILDLGDFAAATSGGGYLVHVLSDQQWCLHWLLYLDPAGNEAIVTTTEPIGFDLPGDEAAPPRFIFLDSEMMGLNVCADTFAEFLYRFWIENEIFFALGSNQPLTPAAAAYAARLPRTATRP
jgi:hypothetical protein